jgi:hypothetical protein
LPEVFTTVPQVLVTDPELTVTTSEYVLRSGEQVGAELTIINGRIFTKFVIAGDVEIQPPAFVTITSIICPFVRVLVV